MHQLYHVVRYSLLPVLLSLKVFTIVQHISWHPEYDIANTSRRYRHAFMHVALHLS